MITSNRIRRLLRLVAGVCLLPAALSAQSLYWISTSTVAANATAYDLVQADGTTHVAYASGGNIYYTARTGGGAWATPTLIGAGDSPSITHGLGGPAVAYRATGNNVTLATYDGSWHSTNFGNIGGTTYRVMVRTDGLGTMYLLNEGSGYGRFDIASNSGSGWSSFSNLVTGYFQYGSGNYYHSGMLVGKPGGGYAYAQELAAWGGSASYSTRYFQTVGLPANVSHGFGYNLGFTLSTAALSLDTDGTGAFAYVVNGTGYVRDFDGSSWSGAQSVGAASTISVEAVGPLTCAVFSTGGNLYQYYNAMITPVSVGDTNLAGTSPLIFATGEESAALLFVNGSGALVLATAIPEPATSVALTGLLAMALVTWRRRRS